MDVPSCLIISIPKNSSSLEYILFCIPGTSKCARVVFNLVRPPPVDICANTAPRLTVHFFPFDVSTRGEEQMEKTLLHFVQIACKMTAKPECILSHSILHVPPHCALWVVIFSIDVWSSFMLKILEPCRALFVCSPNGTTFSLFKRT